MEVDLRIVKDVNRNISAILGKVAILVVVFRNYGNVNRNTSAFSGKVAILIVIFFEITEMAECSRLVWCGSCPDESVISIRRSVSHSSLEIYNSYQ